jgi:hypothetical protein
VERKKRVSLAPGQPAVDVTEVGFRSTGEYWNEYLADDGSVIRMKLVVAELLRVDGEYDEQGNPAYVIRSQQVLNVSAPDELRRDPE